MNIDQWVDGCKVNASPSMDGKNIYVNVRYWAPGSSIEKPPALEKTAFVKNDEKGRHLVYDCTSTCAAYIRQLSIPRDGYVHITVR